MNSTIMIVDDNNYIVDGLVAILKKKGFRTLAAHSGEETLSLLNTTLPDLILLDISMEPMDGWQTLERIRNNPKTTRIPVIVFSARKWLSDEMKECRFVVEAVIAKPINTSHLLDTINKTLKNRQMQPIVEGSGDRPIACIDLSFDRHLNER